MCKLCNSDNEQVPHKHNSVKGSFMYEFKECVIDYTGEYPCRKCLVAIPKMETVLMSGSLDDYIINKLFKSYSKCTYSHTEIRSKAKKLLHKKTKFIEKVVAEGITMRIFETNKVSFISRVYKKRSYQKTFDNIEDAIMFRLKIKEEQ